jgi:hypothetical protein
MSSGMDDKYGTQYSGMMSNYSGQRPGRMGHMIENDDQMKQLASRLIGKQNINEVDKDILREYY